MTGELAVNRDDIDIAYISLYGRHARDMMKSA